MTEAEWLKARDPIAMLQGLSQLGDRKLCLFAFACWQRAWANQVGPFAQAILDLFLKHIDGSIPQSVWLEAVGRLKDYPELEDHILHLKVLAFLPPYKAACESDHNARSVLAWQQTWNGKSWRPPDFLGLDYRASRVAAEGNFHAVLLCDIFGNPFRPVTFDPLWRTSTAVELAQGMYESRDFGAMPILADALQDAGCENDDILTHCRDESLTHVRGCWVVDRVLNKS